MQRNKTSNFTRNTSFLRSGISCNSPIAFSKVDIERSDIADIAATGNDRGRVGHDDQSAV